MVSESVCDVCLLCILLWLYVFLAWAWPLAHVLLGPSCSPARPSARPRSGDPAPVPGLTATPPVCRL